MWPFDPSKPHAEHPLDQMPRRVRRHPEFARLVERYQSRAGGEMTSHGADLLAGIRVWQMLEAADE